MSFFRAKRKFAYWLKAGHRFGHGIHSPYLFGLLTNVIENEGRYYSYDAIDRAWASLMRSNIQVSGSASTQTDVPEKLKLLVRRYDLLPKYGKMLFRLVNEFQPTNIICAGPVSGMSLLYLARADSRIPVNHYDGRKELLPVTQYLLETAKVGNVTIHDEGAEFSCRETEGAFIIISYPENPGQCRKAVGRLMDCQETRPVAVVLNGIHQSPEMEAVWSELKGKEFVRISLDFFTLGLAICRADLQKENFVIRY